MVSVAQRLASLVMLLALSGVTDWRSMTLSRAGLPLTTQLQASRGADGEALVPFGPRAGPVGGEDGEKGGHRRGRNGIGR